MAAAEIKFNKNGVPDFDDLPLGKTDPRRSAWGLYGDKDELGFLNRLTNERVAAAAKSEIQTGHRVSLNWPLDAQASQGNGTAFFGRGAFHQQLLTKAPFTGNDDVWTFNSQISTQWDGLRHFGYQKEGLFYNGVTMEQIHASDDKGKSTINGIQAWSEQGVVGRGVLVDLHSWREANSELSAYNAFDSTSIPLADLKACLKAQGTEVRFGDILIIRSGFMAQHAKKTQEEITAHQEVHRFVGLEQSEEILRWIWDNFSAVAGDQPALECWPTQKDWLLHEVLLGGWGCPIGELFNLEKLAAHCQREKRWSFFVSSEPCNVPGGVASPPNILAIF
ncbi:hypothetical protein E8E14_000178 [Neopestalotiopsis sp. 37M]|nr:hypothetical protein E8E14_000178 [Neopestalotiopsis sp. 37M]